MNKVHEMFPLIVYQGSVDGHEEFKKKYLDSLKDCVDSQLIIEKKNGYAYVSF